MNAQAQQNDEVESTVLVDRWSRVCADGERARIAWGIAALNTGGLAVAAIATAGEWTAEATGEWYDSLSTPLGVDEAPKDEGAKA